MKYASLLVLAALGVWGASLVLRKSIPPDETFAVNAMFRLHSVQGRNYSTDPHGQRRETYWTKDVATLARDERDLSGLAEADTTSGPGVPYHGYYFRALPPPPGDAYAICAYPAQYGTSKRTFFINGTGVFSKDIGGRCLAAREFVRDGSWSIID